MEKENQKKIEKILRIQKELNLTQSMFATTLGMNRSYVNRVLGGSVNVSDKLLDKMCSTFHIPKEYFEDSTPIDMEITIQNGMVPLPTHEVTTLMGTIHKQLDDLISYKGSNDIFFQKDISTLLNLIQNYLICRDEYKDPDEALDKMEPWIEEIIDKIQSL